MAAILSTLAIAIAVFCVWLTVRVVNRRERWAKWTLTGTLALPALYVSSFGPCCWVSSRTGAGLDFVDTAYQPIMRIAFHGPGRIQSGLQRYTKLWADPNWTIVREKGRYAWSEWRMSLPSQTE